ncbi:hypothetical protein GCM10020229_25990 [Kitasatospora albolonga]
MGRERLALVVWVQAGLVAVSLGRLWLDGGRYAVLVPLALGMGLPERRGAQLACRTWRPRW